MPLDGPKMDIPFITVDQMREVDRAMEEDYHIELVQMMENAGLALANLASRRFLDGNPREQRVLVMAGTGWQRRRRPGVRATATQPGRHGGGVAHPAGRGV